MRVYVSSTDIDLRQHRLAVIQAVRRAGFDCSAMEDYPAYDERPWVFCQHDVSRCDVYVGIFAYRYGFRPPDESNTGRLSVTELEYRAARDHHKPCLIFRVDPQHPWPEGLKDTGADAADLVDFLLEVQLAHGVQTFDTPEDLAAKVLAALHREVAGRSHTRPLEHQDFRARHFSGRKQELDELEAEIRAAAAGGTAIVFWGFHGKGGIGKSALAAELAERLAGDPELFPGGVLWVDFLKYHEQPHETAARWLRAWGVPFDAALQPRHECLSKFHQTARQLRPLIVLDNAQRPEHVEALLVSAPGVVTLITTRDLRNIPPEVPTRTVDALVMADAMRLLASFVPEKVAAQPQSAKLICEQCGRLPVFLRAAGAACRSLRYATLGDYAGELVRRGLASLAEHDRRAATVFDLSWEALEPREQAALAVLSQYPGPDFGPNFLAAWFDIEPHDAWTILVALHEHTALVDKAGEQRFRMHDRIRDFAESKLPASAAAVESPTASRGGRRAATSSLHLPDKSAVLDRLLACWTQWELVVSELGWVGAHELARQYHVLSKRREAVGHAARVPVARHSGRAPHELAHDFDAWYHFVRGQAHVLARWPNLFFQQAYNEPRNSPVSRAAQHRAETPRAPRHWLEWVNRPREFTPPACLQVLEGHSTVVTCVALSDDTRRAVSGSADGTVRIWDLELQRCLMVLTGHLAAVTSVACSEDGLLAISGSQDHTVRVWCAVSGTCLAMLEGHEEAVTSVACRPDGRRAVSGSRDRTVRIWELPKGECLAVLQGHEKWVNAVALSRDGRRVLSGADDKTLRLWDAAGGSCLGILERHTQPVTGVAISNDGCRAISGDWCKAICLWNLETGRCTATLQADHPITSLAFSGDGRKAVAGCAHDAVRVWDIELGVCTGVLEGHSSWVTSVAMSPDGRRAISAGGDTTLRLWDVQAVHKDPLTEAHAQRVTRVRLCRSKRHAVSVSWDGDVRLWNLATGRCTAVLQGHTDAVNDLALSADDARAATASTDDTVRIWNLDAGHCVAVLHGHGGRVTSVALSADGRLAVSGSEDKTVRVWNVHTGRCTEVLRGHQGQVLRVVLGPGARRAASASDDDTVRVWDLHKGRCAALLKGHDRPVTHLAFAGADRLISQSRDQTVRLWDASFGHCLAIYESDSEEAARAWDEAQAGSAFRVALDEASLVLRDVSGGEALARFAQRCSDAECTYDGQYAVAGRANGVVYLLRLHHRA
jgi:WD40 repeat protein